MPPPVWRILPAVVIGVAAAGSVPAAAATVELTADTNRDGAITAADRSGHDQWTRERGALYLPNVDDDGRRCVARTRGSEQCDDASDARVNGPEDLADLARLRLAPVQGISAAATGRILVGGPGARNSRLFRRTAAGWVPVGGRPLSARTLSTGADLAIEGRGLTISAAARRVTVMVRVRDGGRTSSDRAALMLAPLVLQNDLRPAQTIVTAGLTGSARVADGVRPTTGPRLPEPTAPHALERLALRGQRDFQLGLAAAVAAAPGSVIRPVRSPNDIWTQDQFEAGWVEMPGPGGAPHRVRIILRSPAEVNWSGRLTARLSRAAIRDALGHRDIGIADVRPTGLDNALVDPSLNSMGNLDGLPPSEGRPFGSIIVGSTSTRRPDPALTALLRAQGPQPVVTIDTSWLAVGHVDEILHVVPASNPRGWTLAVADPRGAMALLVQAQAAGFGSARFDDPVPGESGMTIDEVLADARIVADNRTSADHIDRVIAHLTEALGLSEAELVRVPVLMSRDGYSAPEKTATGVRHPMGTLIPNVINGLTLSPLDYVAPDPHGPIVDGEDLFRRSTRAALEPLGVRVHFIENRVYLHDGGGEVHCGTNALRAPGPTVFPPATS
ncbi:MAG: hypothetical protein H6531_03375 [Actinobacteria bacterium]|nr:hypothetical protein [Thermoleophilia bacterium]MCB9010858.1 hypothetical protein [Actinomycetota bacterium]